MSKTIRYILIGAVILLAVGVYELYQIYISTTPPPWRTTQWEQVDISLANLRPSTPPEFPGIKYGEIPANKLFVEQPGYDTGTAYQVTDEILQQMEEDIRVSAPNITEAELAFKRAIYLKKLASVAFAEPDPEKREILIKGVYDQIHYNIFRLPAITANEKVNVLAVQKIYVHVLDFVYQGAKNPDFFFESKFNEGKYFKELVAKYGPENREIINVLYIDSLYSEQDLKNDNLMVAQKMLALAQLFQLKSVMDNEELRTSIYKKCIALAELYPTAAKTNLHASDADNDVLPKYAYANALGILSRLYRSRITGEQARDAFEDARTALKENIRSDADILYWTLVRIQVGEVEFLYRMNEKTGKPKMNDEIKKLVKETAEIRTTMQGKESADWYNRFFTAMIQESNSDEKKPRPFILAAQEEPTMKAILDELGQ